ncbi:MAG: hypothetical protein WA055_01035 [Candidatus Moraniibacteriota bacterium]
MDKLKKALLILSIPTVLIVGIFVGKTIELMKYKVPLAGCRIAQLPVEEKYSTINLEFPTKKMFQNYYSPRLDFTEFYISENVGAKTIFETFGYGGSHYFKTSDGGIYQCGFYK